MHLLTIHAIYYRIKKVICTNNGAQKATLAMRICVFCCFSKMLFLVQKPLASYNETVPGEGQFEESHRRNSDEKRYFRRQNRAWQ